MNNDVAELRNHVRPLMEQHGVSFETGFLAEQPLRWLPKGAGQASQSKEFERLDAMAYALEQTIGERRVADAVARLDVPRWSFEDLPWPVVHRLMLIYAMVTHAYFREVCPYRTVSELMQDQSPKILPAQLAVPLWRAARRIGIEPTMSYSLYALWNYYRNNPGQSVSVENIELIHSFTGTLDERWFVRIHQAVEVAYAPAISELLTACLLSSVYNHDSSIPSVRQREDNVIVQEMIRCLENATRAARDAVAILKRMREHCDYGTYFNRVRLFFTFPNSVVFDGVEELGASLNRSWVKREDKPRSCISSLRRPALTTMTTRIFRACEATWRSRFGISSNASSGRRRFVRSFWSARTTAHSCRRIMPSSRRSHLIGASYTCVSSRTSSAGSARGTALENRRFSG
ncbi:MAG: indoleamine 2,3-dioxygenase [Candidatus Methylomirabilis sp.]|nr:indoleamine 2,3-dioxygenase [Candidatus Methylomirabilis sp.]